MVEGRSVEAGAILGTFAGDALGRRYEGAATARGRDAADRVATALADPPLVYTDDTQLTLALAEHLCEHPEVEPEALAATILDHFEGWRGYGGGMYALVDLWRSGADVRAAATAVFPDGSFGNGAAMRAAPVGVRWRHDPERLTEVAGRSAELTHSHPEGVDGAVVQAHAVALAAARGRFAAQELRDLAGIAATEPLRAGVAAAADLVEAWGRGDGLTFADVARTLGNEVVAPRSVPAALWAAAAGESVEEGVALALGLGGDADTIAAMAAAVLGAAGGIEGIPPAWLERMEDGPRGRAYALDLAARLSVV